MRQKKKRRGTSRPITTGQLNRIIDVFVHPLFRKDEKYVWLDGLLHAVVERDPQVSVRKFARYSARDFFRHVEKKTIRRWQEEEKERQLDPRAVGDVHVLH